MKLPIAVWARFDYTKKRVIYCDNIKCGRRYAYYSQVVPFYSIASTGRAVIGPAIVVNTLARLCALMGQVKT